jgi:hypothetical protein
LPFTTALLTLELPFLLLSVFACSRYTGSVRGSSKSTKTSEEQRTQQFGLQLVDKIPKLDHLEGFEDVRRRNALVLLRQGDVVGARGINGASVDPSTKRTLGLAWQLRDASNWVRIRD